MPEYLAPGVFVEETSFRAKSIEGVSTSVAAIVGPTRYGPLRGKPEVCTSYGEFRRIFGDDQSLMLAPSGGGAVAEVKNYTAHAARAFFDNGGKQLYVVRTARAVNEFPSDNASLPTVASTATALGIATFTSRFPGSYGSFWLELRWRGLEPAVVTEAVASPRDGERVFVDAMDLDSAVLSAPAPGLPAGLPAEVHLTGPGTYVIDTATQARSIVLDSALSTGLNAVEGDPAFLTDLGALPAQLTIALPAGGRLPNLTMTRVTVRRPPKVAAGASFPVVVEMRDRRPLSSATLPQTSLLGRQLVVGTGRAPAFLVGSCDGTRVTFSTTINNRFDTDPDPLPDGLQATLPNAVDIPVALLADPDSPVVLLSLPVAVDVDVRTGSASGEVVAGFANVALMPADTERKSLDVAIPDKPTRSSDALQMPIAARTAFGAILVEQRHAALVQALWLRSNTDRLSRPERRWLLELTGGTDGAAPASVDYAGEIDENLGSTGLCALEDVEDVSIVMTPAAAADAGAHQAVVNEMLTHCRKLRYRVGIVDSREGMSFNEVRTFRNQFSDDRLALYYPWVVVSDPNVPNSELKLPPAGFVAGTYARTDVNRGVHKAPANEVVFNALRFEIAINKFQQELLNPEGVNCLRSFPRLGHRIWGGRTLGADPEWKYVNVRRYFLYLERSIDKSTQWVVFEPNGERLWANVRDTVEAFLFNEWKEGHLLGSAPKEAYFVRCDRSTMTQNDLDNGRLVCLVGVAPLRPAEFVIFRVGQKTADA